MNFVKLRMLLQDIFCPCLSLSSDLLLLAPIFYLGVYVFFKSLRTSRSFRFYDVPGFIIRGCSPLFLPVAEYVFILGVWQK